MRARVFPSPPAAAAHENRKSFAARARAFYVSISSSFVASPRAQFVLSHCSVILPTGRRRALSQVFNEYFWVAAKDAYLEIQMKIRGHL